MVILSKLRNLKKRKMKVKANKTFFHKSRRVNAGDILELSKEEGSKLIGQRMVKEEKVKKVTKEQK